MLSQNQSVPFTINMNQNNAVPMILDGIPTTEQFALVGTPPASLSGPSLTIDGTGTAVGLSVTTKDADGNTIVGPGSPVLSVTSLQGNQLFKASASGSTVTITTPPTGSRPGALVSVALSSPDCPGGPGCTAFGTFGIEALMTEFVAVTDRGGTDVQLYSERTQSWLTVPGLSQPWPVVFDPKGNLFVGNYGNNTVSEVAPPYTNAPVATISHAINAPDSLALDSKNDLFVANSLTPSVTEYAPPYTGAPVATITGPATVAPYTILVDSKDDLWIANDLTTSDAYYVPAPVSSASTGMDLVAATQCYGLGLDTLGNVDFSCQSTNRIVSYQTTGALINSYGIGEYFRNMIPLPSATDNGVIGTSPGTVPIAAFDLTVNNFQHITANGSAPIGIATDENGTLFMTDVGNGTVSTLAPPYTGTPHLLTSGLSSPFRIAVWP